MGYETFSSGLTIQAPTAGTKNWAETLRTQLWSKISAHDHTGSGKGLQIATAAIASSAVTAAKIASDAVTTAKILDANVTTAKIADGAVTAAKLAATLAYPFATFTSGVSALISPSGRFLGFNDGDNYAASSEHQTRCYIARAASITHLVGMVKDGVSETKTFLLRKNGSSTSQVLTLTGSNNSGYVAITPVSVVAGDYIEITITAANADEAKCTVWGT